MLAHRVSNASAERRKQLVPAFIAGGIAIVLNTLALHAADLAHVTTARGGLLRLIRSALPRAAGLPIGPAFQTVFHLVVGLLMALFYAYALERRLPGSPCTKGLVYAGAVWLLNAGIVLPATGEGFAGSANLTLTGLIWFAVAHTLFFVLLAWIYARLTRNRSDWSV